MVYFMEKDPGRKFPAERFTGDQGKISDLQAMLEEKKLFNQLDLIVDDGSHHPEHQKVSFSFLFDKGLKPGGIYIVEDIEMNYWRRGDTYGLPTHYGKDSADSMMAHLKALTDVVNRRFQTKEAPFHSPFGTTIDEWVSFVMFASNCVIIGKRSVDDHDNNEPYSYPDKLLPP
jgi:hypothetical protein